MTFEYLPSIGFKIDSILFKWDEKREVVREKLEGQHQEDDRIIDMAEFFDGNESQNIEQRRDIYTNFKSDHNYFFLSYDENDQIAELEIHWGIKIVVEKIELNFGVDIDQFLTQFSSIGEKYSEIEEGSYLFQNLKMNIANSESSGGEGNGLSYFYSAQNMNHLIE